MELLLRTREKQRAWEGVNVLIFKIKPLLLRIQGNKAFPAPEEIPHLAATEKPKNEFIYKMTYSWLLCTLHKRLNDNSFHVHHNEFLSKRSKKIFSYVWLTVFGRRWMTKSITAQCLIKQLQVNAAMMTCQSFIFDSFYRLPQMKTYNKIMMIRACCIWSTNSS